jgi:glutamine cyclotransferase
VNLADLMNELADDVDSRVLPTPAEIRRTGEIARRRRQVRTAAWGVVLAVVVVVAAAQVIAHPFARPAPQPIAPVGGWSVVRTVDLPGSGAVFAGGGSVWAVDDGGQELTGAGNPAGSLYRLDPVTGEEIARIHGAVGGWPQVSAGSVWLCTAAGGLNALTRVTLDTQEVSRTTTSHPRQLPHGTAYAGGNLWAANYASGNVVLLDPATLRVRQTIHLGAASRGRAPQSLISDGRNVWVGDDNGLITRFDGRTGAELSHLQLPLREVRFGGIDLRRHLLYVSMLRGNTLLQVATGGGSDRIAGELTLDARGDSMLAAVAVGPGSLWAATTNPDRLLTIDPQTFKVLDRVPLTDVDHTAAVSVSLAVSGRSLWVRTAGRLMELAPGS